MKTSVLRPAALLLVLLLATAPSFAQKGTGQDSGLSRQGFVPQSVTLTGTIKEIVTGPCAHTTGRSIEGTHLIITRTDGEEANVHLGAATAVADMVSGLKKGDQVTITAFGTPRLADGNYIAQDFTANGTKHVVREGTRPVWSGQGMGAGRGAGRMQGR